MKTYPSISRGVTRKHGWTRFGTRRRVIDETHTVFGGALALFCETLGEPIARLAVDEGWTAAGCLRRVLGRARWAGAMRPTIPSG